MLWCLISLISADYVVARFIQNMLHVLCLWLLNIAGLVVDSVEARLVVLSLLAQQVLFLVAVEPSGLPGLLDKGFKGGQH